MSGGSAQGAMSAKVAREPSLQSPLLARDAAESARVAPQSARAWVYDFLEPNSPPTAALREAKAASKLRYKRSAAGDWGLLFERLLIVVIVVNVFSFVLSTACLDTEGADCPQGRALKDAGGGWPGRLFDVIEVVSVIIFTVEWVVRLGVVGVHDSYRGAGGFLWYLVTPFNLVDLASIVPFYVDLATPADQIPPVQFIRLLRLLRFMAVGEYAGAFSDCARAVSKNKALLATSGFAGMAVWLIVASLYYLAERNSDEMIWEDNAFCNNGDVCNATLPDQCGVTAAPGSPEYQCQGEKYFGNILNAMYYTLLNMFGEFPLVKEHNAWGRVVGTFTAVFAVAVFGVPVGVLGDGFGDAIADQIEEVTEMKEKMRACEDAFRTADADGSGGISKDELVECMAKLGYEFSAQQVLEMADKADVDGDGSISFDEFSQFVDSELKGHLRTAKQPPQAPAPGMTPSLRSTIYRMMHPRADADGDGVADAAAYTDSCTRLGPLIERFIMLLIVLNVLAFVLQTVDEINDAGQNCNDGSDGSGSCPMEAFFSVFETVSVIIFTVEYLLRLFSMGDEREYAGLFGRLKYVFTFYSLVDLAAIAPWYIDLFMGADNLSSTTFLRALRLLRLFKANAYVQCMDRYVKIVSQCMPVFKLTLAIAIITWVFFSVLMHYAERDSRDEEMRSYYKDVPGAMWITLLNLSGESPLANYRFWGKIITGIVGVVATAFFCIPIGVLSGAFEKDFGLDDDDDSAIKVANDEEHIGTCFGCGSGTRVVQPDEPAWRAKLHAIVEGESPVGRVFEAFIFFLIFLTILLSILETVESITADRSVERFFKVVEGIAVVLFTVEYLMRLAASPSLPGYHGMPPALARLRYIFSFYALIDMLAILPWYLAQLPGSVGTAVDSVDEQLRLFRILRLLKLDKYYPGITLIDVRPLLYPARFVPSSERCSVRRRRRTCCGRMRQISPSRRSWPGSLGSSLRHCST